MRMLRRLVFGLPWLLAAAAPAQVAETVRVPLPPDVAARLAPLFPPGTKLDMLPGAFDSTRPAVPDDPKQAPYWFGGVDFASTSLSGNEFDGIDQTPVVKSLGAIYFIVSPGTDDRLAIATLHLDTGVLWDGVQWWAIDNSAEDITLLLMEQCYPFGTGPSTLTTLAAGSTSGNAGFQFLFTGIGPPVTIQNNLCSYHMVLIASGVDLNNLAFSRGRAGWFRQVSPAPMTATFTDVPTTHPFFRFVEALFASGITAGCGSGNFCPNDPVTRGQMAVFLAAALGLHFPF
jgi:hypothetical protein